MGNPEAVEDWMSDRGRVDWNLIEVVDDLRRSGTTVSVLTNGTDEIPAEVIQLGIADRFDGIFNSASIGFAKPDRRAFLHVCDRLSIDPSEVFFTDDTASKLAGAAEIGMTARLFEGIERFRQHLHEFIGFAS